MPIYGQTIESEARARFRESGLETSTEMFGRPTFVGWKPVRETEGMRRTGAFVTALAEMVGIRKVNVTFISAPKAATLADCNTKDGIRFNVANAPNGFFDEPSAELIDTVLHELAHIVDYIGGEVAGVLTTHPYDPWCKRALRYAGILAMNAGLLDILRGGDR